MLMILLKEEEREILMFEYEELLNEILQRRQNAWLIHSILLASTFIISFRPNSELLPYPYVVSLGLAIASWFLQLTADHVNYSCRKRGHKIEMKLGMKEPLRRYEELKKSWQYRIKHYLWHALWAFLGVVYFLLLLSYFDIQLLPFL